MRSTRTLALCLFLFFLVSPLAVTQVYKITDLGSLEPTAINNLGVVAGNRNGHAFIWTEWGSLDLGTLPGGTFSRAAGINDSAVVVGTADGQGTITVVSDIWNYPFAAVGSIVHCSNLVQPFVWNLRMKGLGRVGPASDVEDTMVDPSTWCQHPFYGSGINNRGHVVGYTGILGDAFQWGVLWTPSKDVSLFGSSWPATFPNAINNSGQVVGETGQGDPTATSWKDGAPTDLGGLPGVYVLTSAANDVNDLGQIVGWSFSSSADNCCDFHVHAVIWAQDGAVRDLGALPGDTESVAKKINAFGLVVGNSGSTYIEETRIDEHYVFLFGPLDVTGHPFIWSARTGMLDLNRLIPQNSGWVLQSATGINMWGQIVGSGTRNGKPHGFLLTPRIPF